jgi:hypothetical protein
VLVISDGLEARIGAIILGQESQIDWKAALAFQGDSDGALALLRLKHNLNLPIGARGVFLNDRPFLKFPERQKALHSLLLPDSLQADAISTASSIRCRTRGWFAFDPASFCEKNSDLIVRAVFRSRPLKP